jgi:hypothetical protein
MILLFGLILILNSNTVFASNVTCSTGTPKVTGLYSNHNGVVLPSTNVKFTFNKPVKRGYKSIYLKNSNGKILPSSKIVTGNTLIINPTIPMIRGGKYTVNMQAGSVKDYSGHGIGNYSITFKVSILTYAQMKDGLNRAQNFYNTHNRLPNYVSFGEKKILIADFKKIIANRGLKIDVSVNGVSSTYAPSNGYSGYGVTITSTKVTATAKCSCGAMGDYNYHTSSFKNYCPCCGKWGVLIWNPKGVAEGEWTCSSCDADYCAACGKEKVYSNPRYLIRV